MARTFRRPRQSHPISELNVTNLIDLAFTLLIIFMTATPLITQEQTVPVVLPSESKSEQKEPDKNAKYVTVSMDAQKVVYLDTTRMSLGDLAVRLRGMDAKHTVVRIRADKTVSYQNFMSMVDEVKKAGLTRIDLGTQAGE